MTDVFYGVKEKKQGLDFFQCAEDLRAFTMIMQKHVLNLNYNEWFLCLSDNVLTQLMSRVVSKRFTN